MNFKEYYLKESTTISHDILRRASKDDLKKVFDFGYTWVDELYVKGAWVANVIEDKNIPPGLKLIVQFKDVFEKGSWVVYDFNNKLGKTTILHEGPIINAINNWELKQNLTSSTLDTFGNLIDEL